MNNDYEKIERVASRNRKRRQLQRRRIILASIAGVVALVIIITTVVIVKKNHSKNEELVDVVETIDAPSEEDEDAKIEVVYPEEEWKEQIGLATVSITLHGTVLQNSGLTK